MKRNAPRLRSDEAAEAFLDEDHSDLDFAQFKRVRFPLKRQSEHVNMRLPKPLHEAAKAKAQTRGIPYIRYIHDVLEQDIEDHARSILMPTNGLSHQTSNPFLL